MIEGAVIAGGGGGKAGGSGGGLSESADTLKSSSYAQVLDLVCEGEIGGLVDGAKSIYLDDVPLQNADGSYNFSNVTYIATTGTQTQPAITGFDQASSETVVGVEAKISTGPIVRSISSVNTTSVVVSVAIPSLTFMNSEGALGGTTVEYAIDVQVDGGGWVQKVNESLTGKSAQTYERQYRINLPAGTTRQIRLRRITPDSTSSQLNNKTVFKSFSEVIDAKLRYPNSALVGIKVEASQFRSIPRRGYDMRLLKIRIPTNATVRSDGSLQYSGTWDGSFKIAWCSCPAWAYYDMLTTDRYGLGNYIDVSQVDKWSLYTISRYCNELIANGFGGTEPRFSCNVWINSQQEAYTLLNQMTSIFRGMSYWAAGSVTAVQDAPKDPVALFTNANVVDGVFSYQGSSAKARHTVALVTWNDPADQYRQKVEYVEDTDGMARYGVVQTEIVAVGCTSRGQANRVGRWLLFTEKYETDAVGFRTGSEGSFIVPGDIIKVADQYRAGVRIGGRVSAATYSTVTVDSLEQVPTGSLTLYVVMADGTVHSRPVVSIVDKTVTVSPALPSVPNPQSQWILSGSTVEAKTFRVMSVTENDDGEFEITALSYNPEKYDFIENGVPFEERNYTLLSPVPDVVPSVSMSESLYRYQSSVLSKITVSWPAVANAAKYRVEWRYADGNFYVDETAALDYDILETVPGKYEVRITAIGAFGTPATSYASATLNALGKTAPPANVTGFNYSIDPLIGITFSWSNVADIDLQYYEIRQGASWDTGTILTRVSANTYKLGVINGTAQTFWIKAVDTSGSYSATASSLLTSFSSPTAAPITAEVVDNNVLLRWTASTSTLAIDYYEIRRGTTWAGGTVVGRVSNATFTTLFETQSGTYTYWIAAVDIGGNVGALSSTTATVAQPPDFQLFANFNSTFNGTKSSSMVESGVLYLAVNTTETWETHFTSRSWTTPQNQIDAGYPYFVQPTATSGYYEEVFDYGALIASAKVQVIATYAVPLSSATVTENLQVSANGSTWTNLGNLNQAFATNFRYVKYRITVTSTGGDDIVAVSTLNFRLDAKQKSDSGMVSAVSTDVGGTTVNFMTSFVDVASITVSPQGTTALRAVYDFVDVPNPTSFKVLLYDSAGNRASGTVSWFARGY